jgi:Ca2+/H+ antiporter, TMEM165/GDT1 family
MQGISGDDAHRGIPERTEAVSRDVTATLRKSGLRSSTGSGRDGILRRRPISHLYVIEAFLVSTGIVALAEIGDKTQLLAIVLAARFRKPVPIIAGIFLATLLNHALAGALGAWIASLVGSTTMRWALGVSFILMALWMLIPDKYEDAGQSKTSKLGVFGATLIAFFLLEIGDKTQIATVALAAKYHALAAVVIGTTLGMMLANVPAVYLGEVAAKKLNLKVVHSIAAGVFLILGVLVLAGYAQVL